MNTSPQLRHRFCAAVLLAGGLFLLPASAVDASIVDWVTTVSAQQPGGGETKIVVASDGTTYTEVIDAQVDLRAKAYGLCKKPSRVARSTLYIDRLTTGGNWVLHNYFNTGLADNYKSYEWNDHKVVNLNAAERQKVIDACKKQLADRMSQGQSRHDVLSQDQTIFQAYLFKVRHYFGCDGELLNVDLETASRDMLTPITCQKSTFPPGAGELPQPGSLQSPFIVTSAELSVSPEQSTVVTKAHLTVAGEIGANRAGQVKIRVKHNGKPGPVTTIPFAAAGVEDFSFPLTIPCPSGSGGSGGGIGGLVSAPPSSTVSGHLEFDIVAPPSPVSKSNKTFYSVTCKPTPTVAPALPDLTVTQVKGGGGEPLFATIRNIGSAPSAATQLEVRFGRATQYRPVPALAPGASVDIELAAASEKGVPPANPQVVVDQPPKVAELNESNNSLP